MGSVENLLLFKDFRNQVFYTLHTTLSLYDSCLRENRMFAKDDASEWLMRLLLEKWERYLKEIRAITIPTRTEAVQYVTEFPQQKIYLDNPRGSFKAFGRGKENKLALPFDYGEYPDIINPADNMGWDVIIVPSATKDDIPLVPVGHVAYAQNRPEKVGNDKIIIAPNRSYTPQDVEIIEEFFNPLEGFDPIEWY